jgi:hypothetical protein
VRAGGPGRAAAVLCACWRMYWLDLHPVGCRKGSLGVAATALWPRSCRDGGPAQSQSRWTRCSTACSSGSARRSSVWRSHWRGSMPDEAGRATQSRPRGVRVVAHSAINSRRGSTCVVCAGGNYFEACCERRARGRGRGRGKVLLLTTD